MTNPAQQETREGLWPDEPRRGGGRKRRGSGLFGVRRFAGNGRGEESMVPEAEFTSYYGRPIVKPAPWSDEIPAYLFVGGLAAGSSLLAAGADLADLPGLRRQARWTALGSIGLATYFLIADLGRPERFINMLRVVKLTSPMSVGSWILAGYGPLAGVAAVAELARPVEEALPQSLKPVARLLGWAGRPAGLGAAFFSPPLAAYTAVLLGNTATPAWHSAYKELPMVFAGSAAASAAGMAMIAAPHEQAWPAGHGSNRAEREFREILVIDPGMPNGGVRVGRRVRQLADSQRVLAIAYVAPQVGLGIVGRERDGAAQPDNREH